jgi:membrane protease YdiL (CAAX protease family)
MRPLHTDIERAASEVDASKSASSVPSRRRYAAIAEVIAAFILVHITFRAIKHFTSLGRLDVASGLNFTPGAVMLLFTIAILVLCRRSFTAYGLTFARAGDGLRLGLLWGLVLVAGAALLMVFRIRHQAGGPPRTLKEGIAYGLACVGAFFVLARLARRQVLALNSVPIGLCVVFLLGLLCLPLLLAWHYNLPLVHTFLAVLWLVVGAGIGEEVFYRGYIQSRINEVFGRPFRLWGIQFGAGLLVSSGLFGFLHALNSVDYFAGRYTFAWGYSLAAFGVGLLYGCLREISGSVLPGAVTHSILDVLARVPTLIP